MHKMLYGAAIIIGCFLSCKHPAPNYQSIAGNVEALTNAIAKDSSDAQLYYLRADFYYTHKQIDLALKDALSAVRLDSLNATYYVLLSDIYFAQKETDLTEETLQKAITIDKKRNDARLKLAELYYFEQMYDQCIATIDEATKLNAYNPTGYLIKAFCYKDKRDTANYLRMLYLVKDQNPKEIKVHLELGYYYQQKKSPEAIPHYQNALIIDPNNEEVHYNLGQLYYELDDIENAKEQYNILISLDTKSIYSKNALYNMGYIAMNVDKDLNEAINYFSKAIEQDNLFAQAYQARGEAYENLQKYDEARSDYEKCLKIDINNEAALAGLNAIDKLQKNK